MSSPLVLFTALLLVSSTICQGLPDLHKQMTPEQLQSVFHVDTHDAVPHYELVQLQHHENNRNRRRRSIGEGPKVNAGLPPHHVKKDLSKNAYYSELKHEALASGGNHLFAPEVSAIKSHNVSFSAFGQHLNLSLRATQGLFKGAPHQLRMWTVGSEPNATHGLDLQETAHEQHNSNDVGEVFQDEKNMAAILMRRHMETGDLIMEGSIGHDLVIKPLPHELSPNPEESHHIIYKREASAAEDQLSDFAFMEPDDLLASEKLERLQRRQRRSRRSAPSSPDFEDLNDEDEGALDAEPQVAESRTRSRRQAPYIIYPEVLVIVDYDGYRLHGGDNLQVKRYFISFWNGVDLRYRLLKGPRIRISIAGIIISRGRDATPYLERNRVGRDAIDSAAALTDMGKYLFRERRLPVYDIAVAITKLDMCRRTSAYGECNRGTAGFAYVGGACVVNKRLEKVNSVAIIEDTGGFSGIIVAAHEVGHLLRAVHDGSPPPSYLGGPGAQRCAGRMATSCPICATRSGASDGPPARCRASTTSSMETRPPACTTPLMRTAPWVDLCQEPCSRWTPSAAGIGERMPASRTSECVPSSSASTPRRDTVWPTDQRPRDRPAEMVILDMCRRTSAYGECNRGTAGFAYVGGACVVNKRLEKVNSVAIIEDTGGFSGIIVAAHEVGHL
ncbi:GM15513 [Drosophila sechellia]|uniref:GM15513 n=1 Tax=Drosophila sechellia TaxID=7238 RepID=B4I8T0_DROSE|nr:GM15513 [Drosophila sechellia]